MQELQVKEELQEVIKQAIEEVIALDKKDELKGWLNVAPLNASYLSNLLVYATYLGRCDIAKLLLNKGANIRCADQYSNPLLIIATRFKYKEMIELLVSKDPSLLNMQNKNGLTPLHCAAMNLDTDIMSRLISLGAKDNNRLSPFDLIKNKPSFLLDNWGASSQRILTALSGLIEKARQKSDFNRKNLLSLLTQLAQNNVDKQMVLYESLCPIKFNSDFEEWVNILKAFIPYVLKAGATVNNNVLLHVASTGLPIVDTLVNHLDEQNRVLIVNSQEERQDEPGYSCMDLALMNLQRGFLHRGAESSKRYKGYIETIVQLLNHGAALDKTELSKASPEITDAIGRELDKVNQTKQQAVYVNPAELSEQNSDDLYRMPMMKECSFYGNPYATPPHSSEGSQGLRLGLRL